MFFWIVLSALNVREKLAFLINAKMQQADSFKQFVFMILQSLNKELRAKLKKMT